VFGLPYRPTEAMLAFLVGTTMGEGPSISEYESSPNDIRIFRCSLDLRLLHCCLYLVVASRKQRNNICKCHRRGVWSGTPSL